MKRLKTVLIDDHVMGVGEQAAPSFGPCGSMLCQSDGTILSLDDEAFRLLDLDDLFGSPVDVVGKRITDLVECPVSCDVLCKQAEATETAVCLEHPIRTSKNNHKWMLYVQRIEKDEANNREFVRSFIWDVSSCRCKQKENAQETDFHRSMIQNSAAATFVLDRNHRVILWNKACEVLTGIPAEQIEGSDEHWKAFYKEKRPCLADLILDERISELPQHYEVCTKSAVLPDAWQAEAWVESADGMKRYVIAEASPVQGPNHELFAVIQTMDDITHHKQAQDELREKKEQVYELQKMEAVGRLAGGIAHDFNNLLTSILGYRNMIRERLEVDNPLRQDVYEIIRAGERAEKLTKQLLALGMKQMIHKEPINLNSIVIEMGRLLRRTLAEHVELIIEAEPDLWTVMADAGLMEQLIMNLAVNAGDAMPAGGKLTIRTSNVTLGDTYLLGDTSISSGRYVALSVRDKGSGMTPEVRTHIFEPFFTTKPRGKGTGLGLSTVYGIVQQLQGHIDVTSEPGVGSTFTIYLPVVETVEPLQTSSPSAEMPRGTETILVVEDEEAVRKLVVRTLAGLGYSVLEAGDGSSGLEVADKHKGRIDLVLTDVVMPRIGGQEMIKVLRGMRHDFRVMFTSGFTNGALIDNGLIEGTDEIILKPFTRESLAQRVRNLLDSNK